VDELAEAIVDEADLQEAEKMLNTMVERSREDDNLKETLHDLIKSLETQQKCQRKTLRVHLQT
jgi:hypothetical protein